MNKWLFLFLICFCWEIGHAQLTYNKAFIISGNQIWDLKSDGSLNVFDMNGEKPVCKVIKLEFEICRIAKNINDNIFISTKANKLLTLNRSTSTWEDITPPYFDYTKGIAINSAGACFQVIDEGLIDTRTGKVYTPGRELSQSEHRYIGGRFSDWNKNEGASYLMDKDDNLWFGVSYGEWGDDQYVFNTITHEFIVFGGDYILGYIFEAGNNVYCKGIGTKGKPEIQYSVYSRFEPDSSGKKLYGHIIYNTANNKGHEELIKKNHNLYVKDYIGLAAFNPIDKNIYFVCKFGLFKGDLAMPLTDISKWTKIKDFHLQNADIKPRLHQYSKMTENITIDMQEDYDVSMPYNVMKIAFTKNGKLVFISSHDGLGIFDGKRIIILDKSTLDSIRIKDP